jgi:CBS domain-containing protein
MVGDFPDDTKPRGQRLFPVTDGAGRLSGVVTRRHLRTLTEAGETRLLIGEIAKEPVVAFEKEPLRVVASRMAQSGLTVLPVVEAGTRKFTGMISLRDLLRARAHNHREEHHRERVLPAA